MDYQSILVRGWNTGASDVKLHNEYLCLSCYAGFIDHLLELSAIHIYRSIAYLTKPATEEAIAKAITKLRYPIEEKRVRFQCFGNFEVYCDNKPVKFSLSKTKELLAYLVDRGGAECRKKEIISILFEDELKEEYYKKLREILERM